MGAGQAKGEAAEKQEDGRTIPKPRAGRGEKASHTHTSALRLKQERSKACPALPFIWWGDGHKLLA